MTPTSFSIWSPAIQRLLFARLAKALGWIGLSAFGTTAGLLERIFLGHVFGKAVIVIDDLLGCRRKGHAIPHCHSNAPSTSAPVQAHLLAFGRDLALWHITSQYSVMSNSSPNCTKIMAHLAATMPSKTARIERGCQTASSFWTRDPSST